METFVGDTVTIRLNTGIDLTGHDEVLIKYEKPDGSTGSWDASMAIGAYSIEFDTDTNTLDQRGTWRLQAFVEFPADVRLHGKWAELKVYAPLC